MYFKNKQYYCARFKEYLCMATMSVTFELIVMALVLA